MFIPLMLLCKIYRIHVRIEVPPSSDKKLVLVHHIRRVCQFVYQLGGNLHFAQVQTAKKTKPNYQQVQSLPLETSELWTWQKMQNVEILKSRKIFKINMLRISSTVCPAQSDSRVAVAFSRWSFYPKHLRNCMKL